MEPGSGVDYSAVLADLKKRRDEIDAVITLLERLYNTGGLLTNMLDTAAAPATLVAPNPGSSASSMGPPAPRKEEAPGGIPSDAFFGMSISQAAQKFLSMRKKPATAPEIAEALEQGGFPHQSTRLPNTVNSVLTRNSVGTNPIFAKVKRGTWGLRVWYPNYRPKDEKDDD